MTDRDYDNDPYSSAEERIAAFFAQAGTGGGPDPVGAILASHAYAVAQRNQYRAALTALRDRDDRNGSLPDAYRAIIVNALDT